MGKHWPLVPNVSLAALGHVSLYFLSILSGQSVFSCELLALMTEVPSSLFLSGLDVAEDP